MTVNTFSIFVVVGEGTFDFNHSVSLDGRGEEMKTKKLNKIQFVCVGVSAILH